MMNVHGSDKVVSNSGRMRTDGSEAFEQGFWASVDTPSHNCDPARRMLDPMVSHLHALRVMRVRA